MSGDAGTPPGRDVGIPITLIGGPLTCHRCHAVTMPTTWVVINAHTPDWHAPICPSCAAADPELWIWQRLCNLCDQIDDLMVAADDTEQRTVLATLIGQTAEHFVGWRDEPVQEPFS